jgi:hypothetical protein
VLFGAAVEEPAAVVEALEDDVEGDAVFLTELTTRETALLIELLALETELDTLFTTRDTDELTLETALLTDLDTLDTVRDTDELTFETVRDTDELTLETVLLTLETARDTDDFTLETTRLTDLLTRETVLRTDLLMDLNDQAPKIFFISSASRVLAPATPLSVRTLPVKDREKSSTLIDTSLLQAGSKNCIFCPWTALTMT